MTSVPTLSDGVVTLRRHREDDVPAILEQCTDPAVQAWTSVPAPYTLDDARTFVRHQVPGGWESDRYWGFAVTARDAGGVERFAAGVGLAHHGDGLAEIGYATSPWARGRGLTERACRLLLQWGFAERDLQAVEWVAKRWNWPSRRLAWRLGFAVGRERHWMQQRGVLVPAWHGTLARGEELSPRHPWYAVPVLRAEGLVLRPPADADLPRMLESSRRPRDAALQRGAPRAGAAHDRALARPRGGAARVGRARRGGRLDGGRPRHRRSISGWCSSSDLHHRRQAELGFWAHPDARGRGLTTRAVRTALRHAFVPWDDGGLGLRRVHAHAVSANAASRRVLASAGLQQVGRTRREALLGDGTWSDTTRFDLLAEEWR